MWRWELTGFRAAPALRTGRRAARWGITAACAICVLRSSPQPSRRPVRYIVGIDVGGTNLVSRIVVEKSSEILRVGSEPTLPEQGPDAEGSRIGKLARASIWESGKQIECVGSGSPDPLN